jgi:hypothetical protein
MYFSEVEEPRLGKDNIHLLVPALIEEIGVTVCFTGKDKLQLITGDDAIWGIPIPEAPPGRGHYHDGYIRLMLWR